MSNNNGGLAPSQSAATTGGTSQAQNADDLNFQLRQNLNDAVAFVDGAKTTQTFAAITFEDLMDAQITTLTGPDTVTRPNPLNRIQQILQNITNTVTQIKALPPDAFQPRDSTDSTNTPVDGDDPYNTTGF